MAAIVTFTRTLAVEAKRDGIRVNALTPSLIEGTLIGERAMEGGFSKKLFEKARAQAHLGIAEPDDFAALVVFLAGPGAAKLTGQVDQRQRRDLGGMSTVRSPLWHGARSPGWPPSGARTRC